MSSKVNKRNLWIDVLRGLAILGVVLVHTMQTTNSLLVGDRSVAFTYLIELGRYGVDVFFFISGWLLASIYGLDGNNLGKDYLFRRISRIYPLWVLFLCLNLLTWQINGNAKVISEFAGSRLDNSAALIVITIMALTFTLFLSGALWNVVIPGGWSIQAEVAHYILFPLLRNKSPRLILQIATVVNILTALIVFFRSNLESQSDFLLYIIDSWIRLGLYSTFGFFLIGIAGFIFYAYYKESKVTLDHYLNCYNIFILYCLSILIVPCPFGKQIEAVGYLFIMIIISIAIIQNKKLSYFFRILGKYSYFIYFMHFIALNIASWVVRNYIQLLIDLKIQIILFTVILTFVLVFSIVLAIPSMKFIEQPFINIARKVR
jgi:peptidoglycan/LPS O-acetylase OafA/YrhL